MKSFVVGAAGAFVSINTELEKSLRANQLPNAQAFGPCMPA
jgi:hypothetical protein